MRNADSSVFRSMMLLLQSVSSSKYMSTSITTCRKVVGVVQLLMVMPGSETPTSTSRNGSEAFSTWLHE
jgi:hypothetical protein